jgi:hypothetical protein
MRYSVDAYGVLRGIFGKAVGSEEILRSRHVVPCGRSGFLEDTFGATFLNLGAS